MTRQHGAIHSPTRRGRSRRNVEYPLREGDTHPWCVVVVRSAEGMGWGGKVVVEGGRAWDAFPPYSPFLACFLSLRAFRSALPRLGGGLVSIRIEGGRQASIPFRGVRRHRGEERAVEDDDHLAPREITGDRQPSLCPPRTSRPRRLHFSRRARHGRSHTIKSGASSIMAAR